MSTIPEDRWRDDGGRDTVQDEKVSPPALRYPLYIVANDHGVLVSLSGLQQCVFLFHDKDMAERHIAESHASGGLYPLAIPNAAAFRQGLESLPAHVGCAIWDATVEPRSFAAIELVDLFMAIEASSAQRPGKSLLST